MYRIFAIGNSQARTEVDTEVEDANEAAQEAAETLGLAPGERMMQLEPEEQFTPIAYWQISGLNGKVVKVG